MNETDWTNELQDTTTVTMYKRTATTAYDIANMSILSIEEISEPVKYPMDPSAFATFFRHISKKVPDRMNITERAKLMDASASYTTQMGLGFIIRLYHEKFKTYTLGPKMVLRAFLTVGIQFSTTMWQAAAFTEMPEELQVKASWANTSYRAMSDPWNVYVFGGTTTFFLVWVISCLIYVTIFGPNAPNASLYPEIDVVAKCSAAGTVAEVRAVEDLENLSRDYGLGNGESRNVLKAIKGKRLYVGSSPARNGGGNVVVIVTEKREADVLKPKEKYA